MTIVEQHADELVFLWSLRDQATLQPHYSLGDLTKLDGRLEAHIDGLRVAGEAAWQVCIGCEGAVDPGEIFTTGFLAFEHKQSDIIDSVLRLAVTSPELSRGLVSALGWLPFHRAEVYIAKLLADPSPALQRLGVAAAAVHRHNPGLTLVHVLSDSDTLVKARALKAIGELGVVKLLDEARRYVTAEDDLCGFFAAWSVAVLAGDSTSLEFLRFTAESNLPYREKALQIAVRRLDLDAANAWQLRLAEVAQTIRLAVIAAGAIGDVRSIPWLIELMREQQIARLAGEAFMMITGVDIAYQDLERDAPEGFEVGPTEEPEDENVEMDSDENLPWPDPGLIGKWWDSHQGEFQKGTRYLLGRPITIGWTQQVLRTGMQRQRAAAALELAIRQPGQPLFNVKAPGFRQQELLRVRQ